MKPILFESTATSFDTNGLGVLSEATSCKTTQERNGMYETEIKYPASGKLFSQIKMRSIILVLPDNLSQPQPMRVYNISMPIKGIVTINTRHLAYDLMGIVVSPFSASGIQLALTNLKSKSATSNPFTFWSDKTTTATMNVTKPDAIWNLLGGQEGSLLDVYGGGEYEFDRYNIKLYQNRGSNRGVTIRYGKNLTDFTQDQNCEAVYTGVYPYWTDADGNLVTLSEKVINATGSYDFTRIYPLNLSEEWEDAPTQAQLRTRAQKYMSDNNIGVPKVSMDISFVQLEQTEEYKDIKLLEQVGLCDSVTVYFSQMGVEATAKVQKIVFDGLLERNDSLTLGDAKTSLADTVAAQGQALESKPSETALHAAVLQLTATILGANGGAVRLLDLNDDGLPDTLYIADDPDPTKAKKVWRFNYEGWGASSNGFNGPFTLGATLQNGIVADFITAGTLNAARVQAGTLTDKKGSNYWNMDTGEFSLAATTTVGGSTVSSIANSAASSAASSAVSTYDSGLNQTKVFNKLTNNGQTQGIYLSGGKIYINGEYINTYGLTASNAKITGKVSVYNGTTLGGYIGYMQGSTGQRTTDGIGVSDGTGENYLIATDAGVRISNSYGEVLVSGDLIHLRSYSGAGRIVATGNFSVESGTKSRVAETENYSKRSLYCYEMASPMFGDIGEGVLDETGECIVDLDDILTETISAQIEYQVFLQSESENAVWVSDKNPSYFIVHGVPGEKFAWELKVKQKGYEYERLEYFENPDDEESPVTVSDYESLYADELDYYLNRLEDELYEAA